MFRMSSIDLAYHLRAGESILSTHAAPSVDTFTFSVAGRAWLDQQWGAQVLLALVYRAGGWAAVATFHGALVGAAFWFLWLACRARGASARLSAALTLGGFVVCFFNAGMRPQTMAYPLFTATLWILADRRAHPRRLWILPGPHDGVGERARELPARSRPDRSRMDRGSTRSHGDEEGDLRGRSVGLDRHGDRPVRGGRLAVRGRHLHQPKDPRAYPGMGSDDHPLGRRSALLHLGARRRRVPGTTGTKTGAIDLLWLGSFFLLGLSAARGEVWWGFVFPVIVAGLAVEKPRSPADERGSLMMNLLVVFVLLAFVGIGSPWFRDRRRPAQRSDIADGVRPTAPRRRRAAGRTRRCEAVRHVAVRVVVRVRIAREPRLRGRPHRAVPGRRSGTTTSR